MIHRRVVEPPEDSVLVLSLTSLNMGCKLTFVWSLFPVLDAVGVFEDDPLLAERVPYTRLAVLRAGERNTELSSSLQKKCSHHFKVILA